MGKYGYKEIESCVFESSTNTSIQTEELKHNLAEAGLKYSKPFEFNIVGELNAFNQDVVIGPNQPPPLAYIVSPVEEIKVKKNKLKIPSVGDKVTLYFYMFLTCRFVNDVDCAIDIEGDFYSKENTNNRNLLKIFKSDFVCVESKTPNSFLFKSEKNYADFIGELPFLLKGSFKFSHPALGQNGDMIIKKKELTYNIVEIKRNVNPVHKIAMKINFKQYSDVIDRSKKIKKEFNSEKKKIIKLNTLRPEILLLKHKLQDKMINLANVDEFEKANSIKNDINFIDKKINIIDSLETKKITYEEYLKTFCLSS